MKIVVASDTHSLHGNVRISPCDVFIHAGDCMNTGRRLEELASFNEWLSLVPAPVKLLLPGNHDVLFQENLALAKSLLTNATVVIDERVEVDGHLFYFSPWTPRFGPWGFGGTTIKLREMWSRIPSDTEFLVTHGPPFGILDKNVVGQNCGCIELKNRLVQLPKLKHHVFGHIHEGYSTSFKHNIWFINASICDHRYRPINRPKEINL